MLPELHKLPGSSENSDAWAPLQQPWFNWSGCSLGIRIFKAAQGILMGSGAGDACSIASRTINCLSQGSPVPSHEGPGGCGGSEEHQVCFQGLPCCGDQEVQRSKERPGKCRACPVPSRIHVCSFSFFFFQTGYVSVTQDSVQWCDHSSLQPPTPRLK